MSDARAGVLAIVVIAVLAYFGFTRSNPFADPFELKAAFDDVASIKPDSPVRIAGVEVGKVTEVGQIEAGQGGGVITMELEEEGLPVHRDAQVKIRPRIFLEGNKFVDLRPGSPSAPELEDGDTIPIGQTAAPVEFADLLTAFQSDTRADLKTFLDEYSRGLALGGATGFNESIPYWEPAYRNSALASDATLGVEPEEDIQRLLRGQQETFAALARDERSLKDLVTSFNVTARAFARQDEALAASVPALRDALRVGRPALRSLNEALPELRAFAREALPGVKSSAPTLAASIPFVRQLRALVRPAELQGAARELRAAIPGLTRLNARSVPLFQQGRALSRCTNVVLAPFMFSRIPDPDFPDNSNQTVLAQIQRGFVGLAGESRQVDANTPLFHTQSVPPTKLTRVRPMRPPDGGVTPPPHRPDLPCELQELPDLNAPGGLLADPAAISLPPQLEQLVPDLPAVHVPARLRLRRQVARARAIVARQREARQREAPRR
jgi:phospholipid/cholesterol/gamma-HCH transport system substrate-binding protein